MKTFHSISNIFPLMQGAEFETLKADIAANGLIESIWLHPDGSIIDGRNRYRACEELGIEPAYKTWQESTNGPLIEFVVSLNLKRRHLDSTQKAVVALEIEPLLAKRAKERQGARNDLPNIVEIFPQCQNGESGKTRDQAAAMVGTNGNYVQAAKKIQTTAPEVLAEMKAGTLKMPDAKTIANLPDDRQGRVLKKTKEGIKPKKAIREVEREIQIETIKPVAVDWLLIGDLTEIGEQIPDDSINLIFTDPPYNRQSIKLYEALAKLAARVLKPGGICLTYSGQSFLPEIMSLMGQRLEYMWLCGIGHSGNPTWIKKWNLDNQWKPLLMYGKPPIVPYWHKFNDFASGGREKNDHEWQQALGEAEHYIRALCPPGGTVLDPFLGSGTSLVAAKQCGMQFYGIEKDDVTARKAQERILNYAST